MNFHAHLKHLKAFLVLSLLLSGTFLCQAQSITEIVTDFGGYWRTTSAANNPVLPNDSHNVLAFKLGTVLYSTGVDNSILTSNAITYTNGNFKSLPITSINGVTTSTAISVIALAGNYDGVTNGFSNPLPTVKMKDVLTDGINGLNIGTGVIDVPVSARLTFPVQSIDSNSIADAKPDILFTQIANIPTGYNDTMYFVNSSGVIVGNKIVVSWSTVPSLGTYTLDFYDIQVGVSCDQAAITGGNLANTTRPIRLVAYKLADFGITLTNKTQVTSLILQPSGKSDIGFVAYNSDAFVIAPPFITAQPQSKVVCSGAGSSATFSVSAVGTNATYQWMKNGINISGATGTSYTISPVTNSDAGTYEVVISNGGGSVTSDKAYLNTAITRQPAPAAQTIVTGNTVTLSVTATNATSFQWRKDGVNIPGATDSIFTINTLTTADNGSYTVNALNSANSCATVLSTAAIITPVTTVYSKAIPNINVPTTWGASTDGSGSTPVDFTRAEHTFILSNRASGSTLTNLTIAGTLDVSNGIAIISNNTTLDVGKCIRSGTGSITGSTSSDLVVRGNSNLFFTTNNQFLKNFTVTAGTVTMLSNLTIGGGSLPGKLNLTGGTLALQNNKITISSSSMANTSMITALGATAAITYGAGGAFIVERFIPARRAFRFISPSVTTTTNIKSNWMEGVVNPDRWTNYDPLPGYGTHITGPKMPSDSLDATQTYNPSLFTFNNSSQTWNVVSNSSGKLTAGIPFRLMVRGSRAVDLNNNDATSSNTILRATGSIKTGTVIFNSAFLSTKVGDYSYVGNPYACPINWLTLTRSGISNSYYTWDPNLSRRGTYVAYNGVSQTNDKPASLVDENIQSGQAFFIQSTTVTPSLTINEANKSVANTNVFRGAGTMTKLSVQLLLSLEDGSNNTADGFVSVFNDRFSAALGEEDSYKFTNLDENIAINRNGMSLSIEGRPPVVGSDTIPILMWQLRQKDYWIKIDGQNFNPLVTAFLKDDFLKSETAIQLASTNIIPFVVTNDSASFAPNRFSIIFQSPTEKLLPSVVTNVRAYQYQKGIQVEWTSSSESNILQYEVQKSLNGQTFERATIVTAKNYSGINNYSWFDTKAENGSNFYRVLIITKSGDKKYSDVVKVAINATKSFIAVFPNPSNLNMISLQLHNIKEGLYSVDLINSNGQNVYKTSFLHKGGSAGENIVLHNKVAPGNYTLRILNDKERYIMSVIIQ